MAKKPRKQRGRVIATGWLEAHEPGCTTDRGILYAPPDMYLNDPSERLETGPYLMRFLALAADHLELRGEKKVMRRLGVTAVNLRRHRDGGPVDKSPSTGRSVRFATMLAICLRTRMRATELAYKSNEQWVSDVDILWPASPAWPPETGDVTLAEALGSSWSELRAAAWEWATSSEPYRVPIDDYQDRRDTAARRIQRMIIVGTLRRNEPIDVPRLADQLDERPSIVRKALDYAAERFLIRRPGDNEAGEYYVGGLNWATASEVMRLRTLIEREHLRATLRTKDQGAEVIRNMQAAQKRCLDAARVKNAEAFIEADIEFHLAAAGTGYGRALITDMVAMIRIMQPERRELAAAQEAALEFHERILKALIAHNSRSAGAELERHLKDALRRIISD